MESQDPSFREVWGRVAASFPQDKRLVVALGLVPASAVLVAMVVATLAALVVALVADGSLGAPEDWIRAGALLTLAAFGATVSGRLDASASSSGLSDAGDITFPPLLITVVFLGLLYVGLRIPGRRLMQSRPVSEIVAGVVSVILVVWVMLTVLAVTSRGALPWAGSGIVFEGLSWRTYPFSVVLVATTALSALTPVPLQNSGNASWGIARRAWSRATLLFAVSTGCVCTVVWTLAFIEGSPLSYVHALSDGTVWAMAAVLVNLAPLAVAVLQGGTVHGSLFDDTSTFGLLAGNLPMKAWVGIAGLLAVGTLFGARQALRRRPSERPWGELIATAGAYSALWIVVSVFTTVSVRGFGTDAFGDGSVVEIGWVSASLGAFVFATAVLCVGSLVARSLAGWFPRFAIALTLGGAVDTEWKILLGQRLIGRGRPVPPRMTVDHASAQSSALLGPDVSSVRPLRNGHGRTLGYLLGLAAVAALLLVPGPNAEFCGLPYAAQFKADRAAPRTTPPLTVQKNLDALKTDLAQKTQRMKAAGEAAAPAIRLRSAMDEAQTEFDLATASESQISADIAKAQRKVTSLSDSGEYEREALDEARSSYQEFKDFDTDGFFADQVTQAENDLTEAEAPLKRAQARLSEAQAKLPGAQQDVAAKRAIHEKRQNALAPYESKIQESSDLTSAVGSARYELINAQDDWSNDLKAAQASVTSHNLQVAQCHADARPRTLGAVALSSGLLASVPIALAIATHRRRRLRSTL